MVQTRGNTLEKTLQKTEYHYIECDCHSDEHTIRFQYEPDDGDLYLSVFLNDFDPWYTRVWKAIKYVFGYKCKYGHWDTTVFNQDTKLKLKALVERSLVSK